MTEPALLIPGGEGTPTVHIHANRLYCLYHYLVGQGMEPGASDAADRAAAARHQRGVHGIWDEWEVPLASAGTIEAEEPCYICSYARDRPRGPLPEEE